MRQKSCRSRIFHLAIAVLCGIVPGLARAQSPTTIAARDVYQQFQESLVVVTAVSSIKLSTATGQLPDQQRKTQTLGTIISDQGLVMLSNSAIDLSLGMVGQRGREPGQEEFETVTNASSVFHKIQVNLADGSQYFASMLSQHEDLDVAFLLIDPNEVAKRSGGMTHVDLSNRIKEGDVTIADEVIGLTRSSPVYGYIPSVIPGYITAISKGESQTYYVTTAGTSQGVPVFALNGKFVGLTVQRIVDGSRTNLLGTLGAQTVSTLATLAQGKAAARAGS